MLVVLSFATQVQNSCWKRRVWGTDGGTIENLEEEGKKKKKRRQGKERKTKKKALANSPGNSEVRWSGHVVRILERSQFCVHSDFISEKASNILRGSLRTWWCCSWSMGKRNGRRSAFQTSKGRKKHVGRTHAQKKQCRVGPSIFSSLATLVAVSSRVSARQLYPSHHILFKNGSFNSLNSAAEWCFL